MDGASQPEIPLMVGVPEMRARSSRRTHPPRSFVRRGVVAVSMQHVLGLPYAASGKSWLGRDQGSWIEKRSFSVTQDTGLLLHVLQDLWKKVPNLNPLRVGVALTGLAAQEAHQVDLFDKPRNARLVRAIDLVNEKFGKGALIYGGADPKLSSKIAFQRVPKIEEF